jgi:hypothetical protein
VTNSSLRTFPESTLPLKPLEPQHGSHLFLIDWNGQPTKHTGFSVSAAFHSNNKTNRKNKIKTNNLTNKQKQNIDIDVVNHAGSSEISDLDDSTASFESFRT